MSTVPVTGRIKGAATINREIRRSLNGYCGQLVEKTLEKALSGDSTAMLAASNLLLAANSTQEPKK